MVNTDLPRKETPTPLESVVGQPKVDPQGVCEVSEVSDYQDKAHRAVARLLVACRFYVPLYVPLYRHSMYHKVVCGSQNAKSERQTSLGVEPLDRRLPDR
jgi:hypothetical protein